MDMELQRMVMEGYRPVSQGMFSQEETLESIVPDAFPDISRIVSAVGKVFLKDKELGEGSLRLSGAYEKGGCPVPFNFSGSPTPGSPWPVRTGGCRPSRSVRRQGAASQSWRRQSLERCQPLQGIPAWASPASSTPSSRASGWRWARSYERGGMSCSFSFAIFRNYFRFASSHWGISLACWYSRT